MNPRHSESAGRPRRAPPGADTARRGRRSGRKAQAGFARAGLFGHRKRACSSPSAPARKNAAHSGGVFSVIDKGEPEALGECRADEAKGVRRSGRKAQAGFARAGLFGHRKRACSSPSAPARKNAAHSGGVFSFIDKGEPEALGECRADALSAAGGGTVMQKTSLQAPASVL